MKTRLLNLFTLLSLGLLAVLLCGFAARIRFSTPTNHPTSAQPGVRAIQIVLGDGRIALWHFTAAAPFPKLVDFSFQFAPSLKHGLWEFDAHTLPPSSFSPALTSASLFAFPIWCVALPCLIAPALWYRKRCQKHHELEGFPVLASSDAPDPVVGQS
jgi:hypothetical protein